jgi:hypothetical protein
MAGIPWTLILTQAPGLMKAASDFLISSRSRAAHVPAGSDVLELRHHLEELARDQQTSAALVHQLTEQLNGVTQALQTIAIRVRYALILGAVGTALGLTALLLGLLR